MSKEYKKLLEHFNLMRVRNEELEKQNKKLLERTKKLNTEKNKFKRLFDKQVTKEVKRVSNNLLNEFQKGFDEILNEREEEYDKINPYKVVSKQYTSTHGNKYTIYSYRRNFLNFGQKRIKDMFKPSRIDETDFYEILHEIFENTNEDDNIVLNILGSTGWYPYAKIAINHDILKDMLEHNSYPYGSVYAVEYYIQPSKVKRS